MGQQDVLEYLEENDNATADRIAEKLEISVPAVWQNLNALLKEMEVEKIKLSREEIIEMQLDVRGRSHFVWRIKKDE